MSVASAGLVVERPGLRTTVQDLGRPGFAHLGVPRSGAADWFSARLANLMVANPPGAAVLETTLTGPALRFTGAGVFAVTGARAELLLDDAEVPFGTGILAQSGQLLRIGTARRGLRSYVALAGGIAVPAVLGSRSTDTLCGLGPPPLTAGRLLPLGAPDRLEPGRNAPERLLDSVLPGEPCVVRVVFDDAGERFGGDARAAATAATFVVSPASDRVGIRLDGSVPRHAGEAATQGMVQGAIQIPPDGRPIVLLADHAVTGGYPVLGVVAGADLPVLAQSRPGGEVRLEPVTPAAAGAAYRQCLRALDALLP